MEFSSGSRVYLYRIALAGVLVANRVILKSSDAVVALADYVPFSGVELLIVGLESGKLVLGSDPLIHFVRSSSLVVLYFLAFYGLADRLYPDSLIDYVTERGSLRWFRLVTVVGVMLVTYWIGLFFSLSGMTSAEILRPTVLLSFFGIPFGGALVLPLAYGHVLARSQGTSVFGEPNTDVRGFAVLERFMYANASTYVEDHSPVATWWRIGLQYLAVPVFFGSIFFIVGMLYPLPELLLLTAVVVASVRSRSVGEVVDQFDIEARFGTAVRYSVVNHKGLVTVFTLLTGIIASTVGLLVGWRPLSILGFSRLTLLAGWVRLGLIVGLLAFFLQTSWFWLRVAARLPWFVSAWTENASWIESPTPDPPDRTPPRLPLTGVVISSLFFVAAWLTLLSETLLRAFPAGLAYSVTWPVLVAAVAYSVRRTMRSSRSPTPTKDNVWILFAVTVQLLSVLFAIREGGLFLLSLPESMVHGALHRGLDPIAMRDFFPDSVFYGGVLGPIWFLYLTPDVLNLVSEFFGASSESMTDRELQALFVWIYSLGIATAGGLYGLGPLKITGWYDLILFGCLAVGFLFIAVMPRAMAAWEG